MWLELIADGIHVHPEMVAATMRRYPDRVVLVTDAMAAAGCEDGTYFLGDEEVTVVGGVARLAQGGNLAGSTLTLGMAMRLAIESGIPWQQAVRAATILPATYLGVAGAGQLAPGSWADAVAFDGRWRVQGVLRHGTWV